MDGPGLNLLAGLVIASIGLASWTLVALLAPHRYPVAAPVMVLLAFGMVLVSVLAINGESWWVGVFAAANRVIVAGAGVRALWHLLSDARRSARRES